MHAFERGYVLASCLYYGPSGVDQLPWTDHEFDGCVSFLARWRHLCSAELLARVGEADFKTAAHALTYTEDECQDAVVWALSGQHWPEQIED